MLKPTPSPILSSQNIPLFIRQVRSQGGDADSLIERFGLPPSVEQEAEARLSVTSIHALGEACAKEVGDPFFGLTTAHYAPRGVFGIVEFICRSARTLGDAFSCLVRFHALLNDVDQLWLEERALELRLTFMVPGQPLCWGRHCNECSLALLTRIAREVCCGQFTVERIWFAHPEPNSAQRLHEAFGTSRVTFGAGINCLAIRRDVSALPLASADEALLHTLEYQAMKELDGQSAPEDFLGKVRKHLRRELRTGASIDQVASTLRMSKRTLQRRLEQRGMSFQQLVEDVRQEYARSLVEGSQKTIKQIASLLGYSQSGAFVRAYKRWMGVTPGEARRSQPLPLDKFAKR